MDRLSFMKNLLHRKMIVLLVAVVFLFVVLFNSGMFGGQDTRVRISCVGDSITYGSGVIKTREIDSYPSQLQTKLGTTCLVSNYGLRSATASVKGNLPYIDSEEYKESLESKPDIVVLMLGTNDAKANNWNREEYEKGLKSLLENYKQLDSHPIVYLMRSPYCYPINEGGIAEYGIDPGIVAGELGESQRIVAEETGVELIDLFTATEGKEDLYTDGIHFNVKGYDLISDVVKDAIK